MEASLESPDGNLTSDSLDERMNDSSVFTLLFQQCVAPGETAVDIDKLMDFIQKLRLGEQKEGEEVFDSESVSLLVGQHLGLLFDTILGRVSYWVFQWWETVCVWTALSVCA